ncbi:MAG: diguanylate cyclase [Acidaminococcaceae bacterium]
MKTKKKNFLVGALGLLLLFIAFVIFAMSVDFLTETWLERETLNQKIDVAALMLVLFLVFLFFWLGDYVLTQRKILQQTLEQERDYLMDILNNLPFSVFITDQAKIINFINTEALGLFRKTREELIGKPCYTCNTTICHTEHCGIDKMLRTGNTQTCLAIDNHSYMVSTAALQSTGVHTGGFIEVVQDVSRVVELQRTLDEKALELETIYENITGGVLITSLETGFPVLHYNQSYCDFLGYSGEDITGKSALAWIAPEDRVVAASQVRAALEVGQVVALEHRLLKKNGEKIWVSMSGKRAYLQEQAVGVFVLMDISRCKLTEREIQISEERYRLATENTDDLIIDYDINTKIMYHTPKTMELYGVPQYMKNAATSLLATGVIRAESAETVTQLFEKIHRGEPKTSCILKARLVTGAHRWLRATFKTILDSDAKPMRAVGILQDITGEIEAKQQYEREAHYRKIIGGEAILSYEADLTNNLFIKGPEKFIKQANGEETKDYETILHLLIKEMVYPIDQELVWSHLCLVKAREAYQAGVIKDIFEFRRHMGTEGFRWVECAVYLFEEETSKAIIGICYIKDIHELKTRALALQEKSERDLLTGLYNKITMETKITHALATMSVDSEGAFVILDLDNFKQINDTLGHSCGDYVLKEVAKRLQSLFGEHIIGRLGGDEFVVFIVTPKGSLRLKEQMNSLGEVFKDFNIGNKQGYKVAGSAGIALMPAHGQTFEKLYRRADTALYQAKKLGKNTFTLYTQDMLDIGHNLGKLSNGEDVQGR